MYNISNNIIKCMILYRFQKKTAIWTITVKKLEISNKIIKKYIHCRCNKARYSVCSDLKSDLLAYKCMQYKPIQNHKRVTGHLKMHSLISLRKSFQY